jgi:hypothetical protein
MSVEEKKELRLKRGAGPFVVEIGEKRVLGFFEQRRAIDAAGEPPRKTCLAHADGAFEGDIAKRHTFAVAGFSPAVPDGGVYRRAARRRKRA